MQAFHDANHNSLAAEADKHSLSSSETVYRFLAQSWPAGTQPGVQKLLEAHCARLYRQGNLGHLSLLLLPSCSSSCLHPWAFLPTPLRPWVSPHHSELWVFSPSNCTFTCSKSPGPLYHPLQAPRHQCRKIPQQHRSSFPEKPWNHSFLPTASESPSMLDTPLHLLGRALYLEFLDENENYFLPSHTLPHAQNDWSLYYL